MTFEEKVFEESRKWTSSVCAVKAFEEGAAFAKKELEVCPLESWECKKIEKELRAQLAEKEAEIKALKQELRKEIANKETFKRAIKDFELENTRLQGLVEGANTWAKMWRTIAENLSRTSVRQKTARMSLEQLDAARKENTRLHGLVEVFKAYANKDSPWLREALAKLEPRSEKST
jgi:hypothetical protein